ncbi:MAG: hypothetical protein IKM36_05580 [Oscillospiraceae bacterium]|nr:hypothetical protein [Oscillospiraceae bacterium]
MNFIEQYKRLEKLCGEIMNDDRKVSAYIDEMINTSNGAYFVPGWDADLKRLKHYRWIRNQIVHDPGSSEENMCSAEDVNWLVQFHARIMNCTDPLSLYRKATRSGNARQMTPHNERYRPQQAYQPRQQVRPPQSNHTNLYPRRKRKSGLFSVLVYVILWLLLTFLLFRCTY